MVQMKKEKNSMKLLRRMDSGSGGTGRKVVMMKASNGRRKKLQIRGLKLKNTCQSTCVGVSRHGAVKKRELRREEEEETEMALSLSLSISSASDHSSENYDVSTGFDEKSCGNDEEKESFTCVSHGMVSVIGRRREMEDRVRVEEGFMVKGGEKFDFFAVYDGHGGSRVAEACKERLHRVLVETVTENQESFYNDEIVWETVMESCFEKMDEEVNRGRLTEEMVGSTAVVAVVGKEELVVANCGDSRAVLYRGGAVVPLSVDHKMNLVDWFKFFMGSLKTYQKRMKAEEGERTVDFYDKFYAQKPDRPDEFQRIEAAGGRVINWYGPRILGVLATSRSIGDQYLEPFVISKPEVTVSHRADSDEFLILASDGLWDVVSNEVACQVVRRCFIGHVKWASARNVGMENRATRAATVLADLAMACGSSDNISVIVIELKKPTSTFAC